MSFADPCLILLDCQRDQVTGPNGRIDPENSIVIDRIKELLRHARQSGWRVCHCQFQGKDRRPDERPSMDCVQMHRRPSSSEEACLPSLIRTFIRSWHEAPVPQPCWSVFRLHSPSSRPCLTTPIGTRL